MKIRYIHTILLALTISLISTSCNPDDGPADPRATEIAFEKLAGQWTLGQFGSIKVDGADVSANYPDFGLSFTDGAYTTTNAGELFNASGTWDWSDESGRTVDLDDGKIINIQQLTPIKFVFSFTKSDGPVRAGVAGNYIITVEK